MTCLFLRGFFFWTADRRVTASPLGALRELWISELLIRRVRSAWETTLEGRRKSRLWAEASVVEP